MATIKQYPKGFSAATSSAPGGDTVGIGSGESSGGGGGSQTAKCAASLTLGRVVWLQFNGTDYEAVPVDITQLNLRPADGVVSKKYSSVLCEVTTSGPITAYSGLTQGATYWVAADGTAKRMPLSGLPAGACYQRVGTAWGDGVLNVRMGDDVVKTATA